MSTVEIRSPKVKITTPLGEVSCDELEINASINAHTTATFTFYGGKEAADGANKVLDSQAAGLMGRAQKIGFSRRTDPDTSIWMNDGKNKSLNMRMFMTSPTFMMNSHTIRPALAAVAASSLVGNLKLDIYTTDSAREEGGKSPLSSGFKVVNTMALSTNLATRLKELTQLMIKFWKANGQDGGTTGRLKAQRDQVNQSGPLQMWYDLLDNSVEGMAGTSGWMSVIARDKFGANQFFNTELLSDLRGISRDFQEIIDILGNQFQLVMIPDIGGQAGRLALMNELLTSEPKKLQLPASSMLLNGDTSHDLLPLQQVLVTNMASEAFLTTVSPYDKEADNGEKYIGGFPSEAPSASGDVAIVPLPGYLTRYVTVTLGAQGTLPPDVGAYGGRYSDTRDLTAQYANELARTLVQDYARAVYYDMALGSSSCSISMPADTTLWPGDRYSVTNADGRPLFTGFLSGVKHNFRKAVNGGGQAFTTCNFTHVLFPGFTLPTS